MEAEEDTAGAEAGKVRASRLKRAVRCAQSVARRPVGSLGSSEHLGGASGRASTSEAGARARGAERAKEEVCVEWARGGESEEGVFQKALTEELAAITFESTEALRRPLARALRSVSESRRRSSAGGRSAFGVPGAVFVLANCLSHELVPRRSA